MMRPLLESLADDQVWTSTEIQDAVAARFPQITPQDREAKDVGKRKKYNNLVAWGLNNFVRARIIEKLGPGRYRIAPRGHEVLAKYPGRIDIDVCKTFPEYDESKRSRSARYKARRRGGDEVPRVPASKDPSPDSRSSTAPAPAVGSADDYAARLQLLNDLSARGLVTNDELERRRREILAEI
jgi:restriction endonuclease Mrr